MPTVYVKLGDHSKYCIEFEDEYSPEDFLAEIEKQIKFVKDIAAVCAPVPAETPEAAPVPSAAENPDTAGAATAGTRVPAAGPSAPRAKPQSENTRRNLFIVFALLLLVVGGAGLHFMLDSFQQPTDLAATPSPRQPESAVETQLPPVSEAGPASALTPRGETGAVSAKALLPKAAPPGRRIKQLPPLNSVAITARELTWMSIAEDENPAYETVLKPGDRLEREALTFVIRIGNAYGIEMTYNGKRLDLKGEDAKEHIIRRNGMVLTLKLP